MAWYEYDFLEFLRKGDVVGARKYWQAESDGVTELTWVSCLDSKAFQQLLSILTPNTNICSIVAYTSNIDTKAAIALAETLRKDNILEVLRLFNNDIDDYGVTHIAKALTVNKTLKYLNVGMNKEITSKGANALAGALRVNSTLQKLDLANCKIDDEGAKALAKAIEVNKNLEMLNIAHNKIGVDGLKALAKALEKNTGLQRLYVDSNDSNICSNSSEYVKILAEALKINTSLKVLAVSYVLDVEDAVAIGEAVKTFVEALKINPSLEELQFSYSRIGDEGAKAFAGVLAINTTLNKMILNSNEIGDEGAKALAISLRSNTDLQEFHLQNNGIGDEGAKALADALEANPRSKLTKLYLDRQAITPKTLARITACLSRNKIRMELPESERLGLEKATATFALGQTALKFGDVPEALRYFNAAVGQAAFYFPAVLKAADILTSSDYINEPGNLQKAIKILTSTGAIYLDDSKLGEATSENLLNNICGKLERTGAVDGAIAIYDAVLTNSGLKTVSWLGKRNALVEQKGEAIIVDGKTTEAIAFYDQALVKYGSNKNLTSKRDVLVEQKVDSLAKSGKTTEAIDFCEQAIKKYRANEKIAGKRDALVEQKGNDLAASGKNVEALGFYEQAIAKYKSNEALKAGRNKVVEAIRDEITDLIGNKSGNDPLTNLQAALKLTELLKAHTDEGEYKGAVGYLTGKIKPLQAELQRAKQEAIKAIIPNDVPQLNQELKVALQDFVSANWDKISQDQGELVRALRDFVSDCTETKKPGMFSRGKSPETVLKKEWAQGTAFADALLAKIPSAPAKGIYPAVAPVAGGSGVYKQELVQPSAPAQLAPAPTDDGTDIPQPGAGSPPAYGAPYIPVPAPRRDSTELDGERGGVSGQPVSVKEAYHG